MKVPIIQLNKPQPTFGIYIKTQKTNYGYENIGKFKKYNINICYDLVNKLKLFYITDLKGNWLAIKPGFIRSKAK